MTNTALSRWTSGSDHDCAGALALSRDRTRENGPPDLGPEILTWRASDDCSAEEAIAEWLGMRVDRYAQATHVTTRDRSNVPALVARATRAGMRRVRDSGLPIDDHAQAKLAGVRKETFAALRRFAESFLRRKLSEASRRYWEALQGWDRENDSDLYAETMDTNSPQTELVHPAVAFGRQVLAGYRLVELALQSARDSILAETSLPASYRERIEQTFAVADGFDLREVEGRPNQFHLIIKLTDGGEFPPLGPFRSPGTVWLGPWEPRRWDEGTAATHGDEMWRAVRDTDATPGNSDDWQPWSPPTAEEWAAERVEVDPLHVEKFILDGVRAMRAKRHQAHANVHRDV